jgi:hypothetical protein
MDQYDGRRSAPTCSRVSPAVPSGTWTSASNLTWICLATSAGFRVWIEIRHIVPAQLAQHGNVRAENRHVTERRLDDRNPKSFFAAGEEQGICDAVKIRDDFIRHKLGSSLPPESGGAL